MTRSLPYAFVKTSGAPAIAARSFYAVFRIACRNTSSKEFQQHWKCSGLHGK